MAHNPMGHEHLGKVKAMIYSVLVGFLKPDTDGSIHFVRNLISKSRFVISERKDAVALAEWLERHQTDCPFSVRVAIEVRAGRQWVNADRTHALQDMLEDIQRALKEFKPFDARDANE